jgi:hypothetical protein
MTLPFPSSMLNSKAVLLIFSVFSFFFPNISKGQVDIAKKYLSDNAAKYQLSDSDINQMIVSSEYLSPTTGLYHVYFNQAFEGIELHNGVLNLTLKNNQVQHVASSFLPQLQNLASNVNLKSLAVSPIQALQQAATKVNLTVGKPRQLTALTTVNGVTSKVSFADNNLSNENINVKLYWLPYEEMVEGKLKKRVALTWNVRFLAKNQKNAWNIHVDAVSGEIRKQTDDVIHCQFGTPAHTKTPHVCNADVFADNNVKPLAANSYEVFDYPLESPNHGARTISVNPYNRFLPTGMGTGTTNGWHNDGTTDYTTTRGNNVYAQEDINNDDLPGQSPNSPTLEFSFPYTKGTATAVGNRDAAITNLFYWNNVLHDVLWRYGFDEPSGNFQKSNMGKGGLGNDYVIADAQDGGGIDNANFYTPIDGTSGRMQMYLWSNAGTPLYQPDGDFDNGIIAHEYGHGWSIRLTGGPANSDCLDNVEQGGEGWSDYASLMFTTNWSALTPTIASANIPKGIGTYALGESVTGAGIRPYRYSYDMTNVNGAVTYAKVGNTSFSEPHGIGSIWATILWDMTWEIILQDNQIVNNIYDTPANILDMKGNIAALKLVNEGLRLQPCSPSFVDARDAIFRADVLLFGGRYRCAIGKAFARRGLGVYASTGASSNDRIVTEDFTPFSGPPLTSPTNLTICSNDVFNYTATALPSETVFSWTRATVAGISNPTGSGNSANINETLVNTTNNPVTVSYFFTLTPNTCAGAATVPQLVTVVVNPTITPVVANYTVCQGSTVPTGGGMVAPNILDNTVRGNLVVGPTYRRGTGDNTTTYSGATSGNFGSAVYFQTYSFVAPSNGAFNFQTTQANLTNDGDDTYLSLYQIAFNPASPATNFLRGDDDSGAGYLSSLTHSLVQGTTYILVVSSYSNRSTGSFELASSIPVFPTVINWYSAASGGTPLATGQIFNPVGVVGSGITNTNTVGSNNFYVSNAKYPNCRRLVTFTVINSVGGSITGGTIFCSNTNNSTLTLTGQTGTVQKWQSSLNKNFTAPTDIVNTTNSLTVSNVLQNTYYRAIIKNGTCADANSSLDSIRIFPMISVPTVPSNLTLFLGEDSTISVTGCNTAGFGIEWYKSSDNQLITMPISPTTTTQYYAKCKYLNNAPYCSSENSNNVTVTVADKVISIISGNWEDENTWDVGRVPSVIVPVVVEQNHTVTINTEAKAKNIEYRGNGQLNISMPNGKLKLGI